METHIDGIPAVNILAHRRQKMEPYTNLTVEEALTQFLWEGTDHEEPQKSIISRDNNPQTTNGHQDVASPPQERQRESNQGKNQI